MDEKYVYQVTHPKHGTLKVEATSRYWAIVAAAKEWGVRWTEIAKDCRAEEQGKVPPRKTGKERKAHGKADKKKLGSR